MILVLRQASSVRFMVFAGRDVIWPLIIRPVPYLFLALIICASTAFAQENSTAPSRKLASAAGELLPSPILTLDQGRLLLETRLGREIDAAIKQAFSELTAENRVLEMELVEEERLLTLERDKLSVDEFRVLAEAFDQKVEVLRIEQEAKSRALSERRISDRRNFMEVVAPILGEVLIEMGAQTIIDNSAVILTFVPLDITNLAIQRLDEAYLEGELSFVLSRP